MPKKKVTLYVGDGPLSISAKNYLVNNNVESEEVDATKPEGIKRLVKTTRQTKLPFLEVRSSHGVSTSVGFDEFLYACALNSRLSYDEFLKSKQKEHTELEK